LYFAAVTLSSLIVGLHLAGAVIVT